MAGVGAGRHRRVTAPGAFWSSDFHILVTSRNGLHLIAMASNLVVSFGQQKTRGVPPPGEAEEQFGGTRCRTRSFSAFLRARLV